MLCKASAAEAGFSASGRAGGNTGGERKTILTQSIGFGGTSFLSGHQHHLPVGRKTIVTTLVSPFFSLARFSANTQRRKARRQSLAEAGAGYDGDYGSRRRQALDTAVRREPSFGKSIFLSLHKERRKSSST